MTFRVECFIQDKSLGDALKALAVIKGVEIVGCPQHVVNRAKGGAAVHGSRLEAATAILNKMPTPFTVMALKAELKTALGIVDPNYYIQRWKRAKLIKMKERGMWQKLPHKVA